MSLVKWLVNTAMRHWMTKVVVPIGTVKTVSLIEKHGVRDIRQIVVGSQIPASPSHPDPTQLPVDSVGSWWSGIPESRGNWKLSDKTVVFPSSEFLIA